MWKCRLTKVKINLSFAEMELLAKTFFKARKEGKDSIVNFAIKNKTINPHLKELFFWIFNFKFMNFNEFFKQKSARWSNFWGKNVSLFLILKLAPYCDKLWVIFVDAPTISSTWRCANRAWQGSYKQSWKNGVQSSPL